MTKRLLFVILSLSLFACASAQPKKSSKDNPVDKYAEEAYLELMKPDGDKQKALDMCNKGIKKDSTYPKLWEYKAAIQYDMQDYKGALKSYNKLFTLEPDNYAAYYFLGKTQRMLFQFDEAKASFEKYINATIRRSKVYEDDAKAQLANMDALKKLFSTQVEFKPQNLGPLINSEEGEYWPGLTLDGKYFYYTRSAMNNTNFNEDFYRAEIKDSVWGPGIKLPAPINTNGNEGTISISADGKTVFFSSNYRTNSQGIPMGLGRQDIYLTFYNNGNWSTPFNIGAPINTEHWDAQPAISPDGLTLYFTSNRPGGFGGFDLYMSTFKDGRFQSPVNLGPDVNTKGNEQASFMHYDNQTLYFSSDGHVGAGGSDIFIAKRGEDGKFSKPVNIGVPINTEKDELGMIVDRYGKFGYLSSERPGGYGSLDIYKFELPQALKPEPVSYVQGIVYDAVSKAKLVAKIELTDLSTGKIIANIESQKDGSFFIVLKSNRNYMLTIDQVNYLFYSANFSLKEHPSLEPYQLDVPLTKPDVNTEVVLNNVFFDVDKFELKSESMLELDKLVHLLKKFPFMKIEIGGHTDNTGDKAKNKTLSFNRAKAVKDYLVKAGIDATRLAAVGYGDTAPVADNKDESGRARNRRTVFKVMSVN
jgi:outer membrane protein OmpA-like peptidoglycan-associated protein/tetratricopeptide (TPR) repeat protein